MHLCRRAASASAPVRFNPSLAWDRQPQPNDAESDGGRVDGMRAVSHPGHAHACSYNTTRCTRRVRDFRMIPPFVQPHRVCISGLHEASHSSIYREIDSRNASSEAGMKQKSVHMHAWKKKSIPPNAGLENTRRIKKRHRTRVYNQRIHPVNCIALYLHDLAHRTSGAAAAAKSRFTFAASAVPGRGSNMRTHHAGGSKGR